MPVDTCSSLENSGIDTLWQNIYRFQRHMVAKGYFEQTRQEQSSYWLRETITESLLHQFYQNAAVHTRYAELETAIKTNKVSPFTAGRELIKLFLGT